MTTPQHDRPALLVIDMVKDNFNERHQLPITPLARRTIEPINRLSKAFRRAGWPVVFATDAFKSHDFLFTGRMKPHALAGTPGAEVIDELLRKDEDLWLPKPRFSAFFRTGLEEWLKEKDVTLCAVTGIATNFCVLTTALDAICCDFKSVLVEDCTAASTKEIHEKILDLYRRNPLYPLLKVSTSEALLAELKEKH
jgi:nicotinamidase-related amidase